MSTPATMRQLEEHLVLALAAGGMAAWDWDVPTGELTWSTAGAPSGIADLDPSVTRSTYESYLLIVHPDDRERMRALDERCVFATGHLNYEYRTSRPGRPVQWRVVWGRVVERDDAGQGIRVVGVTMDVTTRKHEEERIRTNEARLRLALEAADVATWELDLDTQEVTGSENLAALIGLPTGTMRFPYADSVARVHADDRAGLLEADRKAIEDGCSYDVETRIQMPDGTLRWLAERGEVIERDHEGRALRMVGITRDITGRKREEERIRQSELRLAEAQRLAQLGSWEWDVVTNHVTWSDELYRVYGRSPDRAVASFDGFMEHVHPDDRQRVHDTVMGSLAARRPFDFEFRIRRDDGTIGTVHALGAMLVGHDGEVRGMQGTAQDVTARKALEGRLRHQAFHDALTGLPNRALALDRLNQALARAGRTGGRVAVIFLDLDHFKGINDSHGHASADAVLGTIAQRLQLGLRDGDTVARFAGDEFVCVLEDLADAPEAEAVAARIGERLQLPIDVGGRQARMTASIGVAMSGVPVESAEELLQQADQAMYVAKRAGKARTVLFHPSMNTLARERLDIEADLRRALDDGELYLDFQPIVDLTTGAIPAVEALVRWLHPARGPISPVDFIPVAEETELIFPLGRWVLEDACRQAMLWPARAGEAPPAVTVNLSARQIAHPMLASEVTAVLTRTGLPPERLILEITERVALADDPETIRSLAALRKAGVAVAIDDFGTGYSGLSSLKVSTIDILKIDRGFIAGLGTDQRDTGIVQAVLGMARALGLTAVAEGVETEAQLMALRALGCRTVQGYYIARPMPSRDLMAWLGSTSAGGAHRLAPRPVTLSPGH